MGSALFKAALALAGALSLTAPAAATTLYCCQDAGGRKVCGDTLPSACIGRNYTVKGPTGTKQVEGQVSPELRAQREEEAKRRQQAEEVQKEQRRQDQALLNTYASEKDVDVARERVEKDLLAQIKRAEDKIAEAGKRRKKLDQEAEFYKNKPQPEELRRGLKDTEFEAKAQGELIEAKKKELDAVRAKFAADKARYQELSSARLAPR